MACGLLRPIYFLLGVLGPFTFIGHPWSIYFPWASSTLSSLVFPCAFTNSFRLHWPNYFILHPWALWIFHQPLTFFYFHYFGPAVAHSHFSTSHTTYEFATSLFPGSFRPICFLKAHLFISWVCDSLFLLLRLNGFSIHLLTLFCLCCWAFSFYWASQNDHQQRSHLVLD